MNKSIVHDGHKHFLDPHYTWRHGDPSRDMDAHGRPVEPNYVVIVRWRDVAGHEGGTVSLAAVNAAPGLKGCTYGATNKVYGPVRWGDSRRTRRRRTVFLVQDNHVYKRAIEVTNIVTVFSKART